MKLAGKEVNVNTVLGAEPHRPEPLIPVILRNFDKSIDDLIEMSSITRKLLQEVAYKVTGLDFMLATSDLYGSGVYAGSPKYHFLELEDRFIERFFREWDRRYRMADNPMNLTLDLLFIEPNSTYTEVVSAWLFQGAHPSDIRTKQSKCTLDGLSKTKHPAVKVKFAADGTQHSNNHPETGARLLDISNKLLPYLVKEMHLNNPNEKRVPLTRFKTQYICERYEEFRNSIYSARISGRQEAELEYVAKHLMTGQKDKLMDSTFRNMLPEVFEEQYPKLSEFGKTGVYPAFEFDPASVPHEMTKTFTPSFVATPYPFDPEGVLTTQK